MNWPRNLRKEYLWQQFWSIVLKIRYNTVLLVLGVTIAKGKGQRNFCLSLFSSQCFWQFIVCSFSWWSIEGIYIVIHTYVYIGWDDWRLRKICLRFAFSVGRPCSVAMSFQFDHLHESVRFSRYTVCCNCNSECAAVHLNIYVNNRTCILGIASFLCERKRMFTAAFTCLNLSV